MKTSIHRLVVFFLSFHLLASVISAEPLLPLNEYLQQVKTQGPEYSRAVTDRKITDLNRQFLGKRWYGNIGFSGGYNGYNNLLYSYNSTTSSYSIYNWYESNNASLNGNLSFSNNWDFGINTGFSYSAYANRSWYTNYPYSNSPYGSANDFLSLNVGIPLWKNLFGAETRARDKSDRLRSDADIHAREFYILSVLNSAKQSYYNLVLVREELAFRREVLEEYKRLLEWAKIHLPTHDRLQIQSALQGWELNLENVEDRERQARNNFNLTRGKEGSEVIEDLQTFVELNSENSGGWPVRHPDRLDRRSNRLYLESAKYSLKVTEESTKLDLFLSGSVGGNLLGRNNYYYATPPVPGPLINQYSVGINLSIPFDYFTDLWDVGLQTGRMGLEQQELGLKITENADTQQWEDMTIRFNKSEDRVREAALLEKTNREKQEQGKILFKQGKARTYEMIGWVDQYFNARMTHLSWVFQKLTLLDQAELYQAEGGEWKKEEEK